ncbi:type III effector HrpK domain-containing protein [Burkholderia thailandensis]|uniref:type III effector HrpK domain-containing protein n=1 Tax=Burkholderia thailandensis TaxID=57975 RepID=UPI002D7801BF|nr:type III effector HrpK domain-containing protein [Burkholderia thailandensis]WRS69977.1 type III effector HrpK domain-containing protein [Burkholderia thailandensis]
MAISSTSLTSRQSVDLTGCENVPGPAVAALQSVEAQLHQLMARQLQGGVATAQRQSVDSSSAQYAPLDDYTQMYDQADQARWSKLAAVAQGVSLERPLAALQILTGERQASAAQTAAAMQFVNDNPTLKTAMQNTGALKSDGSVDRDKIEDFLKQLETNLAQADDDVESYRNDHPDAGEAELNTVRSAALVEAYEPMIGQSAGHQSGGKNAGHQSTGKNNNNYSAGGKNNGGGLTTKQQVDDVKNNKGFSSAMRSAAEAWSTTGAFDALNRSGDDKAIEKADNMFSANNLHHFITKEAPTSNASEHAFLEKASLENVTAGTDISKLNQDIFANPQNYSPQQKAAVMVKLMETLVDVQAGGSDNLRDVTATVSALKQDISLLANDPETNAYLHQTVSPEMQSLYANFAQAGGVAEDLGGEGDSGGVNSTNQVSARQVANQVEDSLDNAERGAKELGKMGNEGGAEATDVTESVTDGAEAATDSAVEGTVEGMGDAATSVVDGAEGAVAGVTEGFEGAVAGAEGVEGAVAGAEGAVVGAEAGAGAAEGVLGAVAGGMAAAAPVLAVGAAIAGIAGIIIAIVEAVKKAENRKAFAENVNPTLNQFGIPLPK